MLKADIPNETKLVFFMLHGDQVCMLAMNGIKIMQSPNSELIALKK